MFGFFVCVNYCPGKATWRGQEGDEVVAVYEELDVELMCAYLCGEGCKGNGREACGLEILGSCAALALMEWGGLMDFNYFVIFLGYSLWF